MSAVEAMIAVAQGRRPLDTGLLENCRLEWAGGEAYGEEAILASFRANPLPIGAGEVLRAPHALAWIGEGAALFADLYDERIGRIWRTGNGVPPVAEPVIGVAFDPDMRQQRGDVLLRAEDHPGLDADCAEALVAAARRIVESCVADGAYRARAFVVRAFSAEAGPVALCAIHQLGDGPVRSSGFAYAVLATGPEGDDRVVIDQTGSGEWCPRL